MKALLSLVLATAVLGLTSCGSCPLAAKKKDCCSSGSACCDSKKTSDCKTCKH
ncbi:MAG: hypothetical protein HS117_03240 [Verrucomicrobiaceae bacterium]|jgi:hypothetical protein|nr:hypothetical protein [Verrucomicrobiaceae bacterium]